MKKITVLIILVMLFLQQQGYSESSGEKPVTGAKAWALGCAAVLTERNHERHDTLAGGIMNESDKKRMKEGLFNSWDVNDKESLIQTLMDLDSGGHRERFDEIGESVTNLNVFDYQNLLDKFKGDEEKLQDIKIAKQYYNELGDKSLVGWDFSRYIFLCRRGYVLGYISEDEAWDLILYAAEILQDTFDSWEDLGRNYLIGRQFWSYKETQDNGYMFEDAFMMLMETPTSPWNKYPWNYKLRENDEKGKMTGGSLAKLQAKEK